MLATAALGAVLAGGYGVVHDQITYTISPEYFTKLKFAQFPYADLSPGQRVYVGTIGFLATWWVGGIFAWFLARRLAPGQSRGAALRQIIASFAIILACALLAGLWGHGYGLWRGPKADYSGWMWAAHELDVVDIYAFARVAYMLIAMPLRSSTPVNAWLVNCAPWSVLKISGRRCAKAASSALTQKLLSSVFDSSHEST